LLLNDEQEMLRDAAAGFVAQAAPVSHLRSLRDTDDQTGFSREVWAQFGEMGLTGALIPEAHGGSDLGHVEAGLVLSEIGRNLSPSPFLQTAVGAVTALKHAAPDMQAAWLPKIAAGKAVIALAMDEGRKHRPASIATTAEKDGNGYKLNGRKTAVPFGHAADLLIVAARTSGAPGDRDGISLFAVDREAPGLEMTTERLVDSSLAADITFTDVKVTADALLGEETATFATMLMAVRAGAAAEIMGLAEGAATSTLDYIRERKQFGQPVGAFQALQHRAAHLYAEMQVANAANRKAQFLLDTEPDQAEGAVAVAKAMAGRTAALAVQEGVQMHGGVGMTDEYDIGLFMKRHRALEELFGDANFHTEEFARMNGY
ncbi:MAG: acyl-CoA dehydrogenase family protein, partial [Pseudomonadota bacterium]